MSQIRGNHQSEAKRLGLSPSYVDNPERCYYPDSKKYLTGRQAQRRYNALRPAEIDDISIRPISLGVVSSAGKSARSRILYDQHPA